VQAEKPRGEKGESELFE